MADPVLRADAARNRAELVQAARQVFRDRGLDGPLDEIARRAGVGNATLYRHFPARCDLVGAVFAQALVEVIAAADRALAEPDPWTAFSNYVTFLCGLQNEDRGLADLLTTTTGGTPELDLLRARAHAALLRIVRRATSTGALRADFRSEDMVLLLMANAGLVQRTAHAAPTAWRRTLSFTLDGLRAPAATKPAPSPGRKAVERAMAQSDRDASPQ